MGLYPPPERRKRIYQTAMLVVSWAFGTIGASLAVSYSMMRGDVGLVVWGVFTLIFAYEVRVAWR